MHSLNERMCAWASAPVDTGLACQGRVCRRSCVQAHRLRMSACIIIQGLYGRGNLGQALELKIHWTDTCSLPQGLIGLTTNPVLANGIAGLATSATGHAAVEVRELRLEEGLLALLCKAELIQGVARDSHGA